MKKQQGFTLIELAIVLAIIGLLVGGILGLSSYTQASARTTVVNEAKFFISAFQQFQTRYNAPPGDFCSTATVCGTAASQTASTVWSTTNNGDGNGLVRAASTAFQREQYYAFQHLALAGFISGTYTGAANGSGGATAGLNVAGSSVEKTGLIFDHPNELDGFVDNATTPNNFYFDGNYANVLIVAGLNDNSAAVPALAFLTPRDTYALDGKFDDGQPGNGNILTPKAATLANCASSATAYNTTYADKACYLILKMQ